MQLCCLVNTSCSLSDPCSKFVSSSGGTVSLVCGSHWAFLFALGILVLLYFLTLCSGSLSISGFWWVFPTMTSYVHLYSSTCSAQEYFFSGFFTAVSNTSYLLAWPLRFHAFLLFTSIGYLVYLLGTLYYSCTGLFTINLEQYLLWVI